MEERDVADALLVTEVFTPQGNWSSYPPHRHDEDDFPRMTYLEESYYHRLNPAAGFGLQRVFTEDGTLDETMAVGEPRRRPGPEGPPPLRRPLRLRHVLPERHGRPAAQVALPEPPRLRLDRPARRLTADGSAASAARTPHRPARGALDHLRTAAPFPTPTSQWIPTVSRGASQDFILA